TWLFQVSASGDDAGVLGPRVFYQNDATLSCRVAIPAGTNQTALFGFIRGTSYTDQNDLIAFRVTGAGNVIGVCDSGGTETTRDTGATGATEASYRIEIRENGTIVRFYKDGVQVGADVTTNIPTDTGIRVGAGITVSSSDTRS